ncbi:MAG TPA: patatin-like phospholipase family protein [Patescibacteria group bacterium]|nr:patatin-like phospholipase family protein [Patescibacteria group bacterium]
MSTDPREQRRFVELFGHVPWFATLPDEARVLLAAGCGWHRVAGGEALFFEGEASDAVYLLVNGSLAAFQRDAHGASHLVGHIMAGESVGELGVLISRPRSATVRALRDSELVRLPAAHLDVLAETFPQALLGLARLALRRQGELQPHGAAPRTLALLPHSPGVDLDQFADRLARDLTRFGSVRVLRAADAGQPAGHYHEIETASKFVLYVADQGHKSWRQQCRRQADAVLFLVLASDVPASDAAWPDATDDAVARRQYLVVQHLTKPRLGAARRWHAFCPRAGIHHVRDGRDTARIARLIGGQSLALVLSGGGARGFAHIGVVKALREAGMEIDSVAGTSIGAIIGAGVAAEWSIEEMTERFRRAFYDTNPLSDYTLPLVSLVSGRKVSRLLRETYGERDMEDLPLPFFCVSANLTRGDAHIHRDGKLWAALRASVSIPGLLPPVFRGGQVFVDGGVVNNLPVDLMRAQHRGEVIAVDIGADRALAARGDEYELPPAWKLWMQDRAGYKRPHLNEILLRAGMINSGAHTAAARAQSTLLITPPLADIGLLEWQSFFHAIDRGYQHTLRIVGGPKDALADETPVF